ncbi:unnamed protein product [Scytosiphon promiscuus]
MRGLEGSAGRGPGRRSKSLEGVPVEASPRSGDSPDAFDGDGDDSAATAADDGGGADGCVNNLFERFAARPPRQQQHRPPTTTAPPAVYDDSQPAAAATAAATTKTEEVLAQAAAAAAAPGVSCSGATGKTTPTSANENRRGSTTTTANANAAAAFPSTGADGTGADDDARERETTLGDAATSDEEAGASGGGAHSPGSFVEEGDSRIRSLHPLAAAAAPLPSTLATSLTRKPSEEGGCAAGQAADVGGRGCRGRRQRGLVGGDGEGHSEKACFAGGNVRKKSSCRRGSEDGSGKQRGSGGQLREAPLDTGDDAVMPDVFAKFVYSPS